MARDLPIGNGNVLINFDTQYNVRDIYYPYVGQENQAIDHLSHFGVWTDEDFYWIDHPEVQRKASYLNDSMVTNVECVHNRLGLKLLLRDGVDVKDNVWIRKVKLDNMYDRERKVKLYFHLDLHLYGNGVGDTVYFDPELRSLVFYKGQRYMSLSCCADDTAVPNPSSYATGQKELHGLEGTWRDAEDGMLGRNPIAQGSVDGTIELELTVPAKGTRDAWFWICFGGSLKQVTALLQEVSDVTPQAMLQRTYENWVRWLRHDSHELDMLPADIASFYKRSLLIIRTNMDNRGAILAANDSDILKFSKDTYSYMWPRDGALIAHALDRSGYHALTRRFFDFCRKGLSNEGYILHKYNPDGSVGSSWHPWVNAKGEKQLAIQEDETALVVYALWNHHRLAGTLGGEARQDYEELVLPAADFMTRYRDASGLPLPSFDLWEERYGVHSFTVASVYAGLNAAANFAGHYGDKNRAMLYRDAAAKVKEAAETSLYDTQENRFVRSLYWNEERSVYEKDMTLDASMYGLFDFELFAPDDPRIESTMNAVKEKLWIRTDVGGIARYTNDYYHQVTKDIGKVPGNPWFICTLWIAEWMIARAKKEEELKEAVELMKWVMNHALPTGILAEQIHPFTGAPLSVSPLTWSHASFVKVVQEYLAKLKQLKFRGRVQLSELTAQDNGRERQTVPQGGSVR